MTSIARRELDSILKKNPDITVQTAGYNWDDAVASFPTTGAPLPKEKGKHKYGAKSAVVDGVKFHSQKEAMRYIVLDRMQRQGEIEDLKLQPKFTLQEGFDDRDGQHHKPITYKADFSYRYAGQKTVIIEDAKGMRTQLFNVKWKWVIKQHLGEDMRFILT